MGRIKVTLKDGTTFEAAGDTAATYSFFGAKVECLSGECKNKTEPSNNKPKKKKK